MLKALTLALCALLAFASPAFAADLPATAATVQKVWLAAKPGDTIKPQGAFGLTVLQGRAFDPPVTIDASAASFPAVILRSVSGVTWRGGAFTSVDTRPGVLVEGSQKVRLERLNYRGAGLAVGVYFNGSRDVELTLSRFDRPKNMVTTQNVTGLRIIANTVTGWSADGIGLLTTTGGVIQGNAFIDPIKVDPNMHMDAIQGYNSNPPNRDILIAGNYVKGADTQGVFVPQGVGYPPPEGIRIVGNTIATADAPNGIVLQNDKTGEVSGNRITTLPESRWQTVIQASPGVPIRCGNSAEAYGGWRASADPACK